MSSKKMLDEVEAMAHGIEEIDLCLVECMRLRRFTRTSASE
jgi:hypothetical protein